MTISKGERRLLVKMAVLFEQLQNIENNLQNDTRDQLISFHNEKYSVPHCIRWGSQGIAEILQEVKR